MAITVVTRNASSALNRTGGFLGSFTHSHNPAIGCAYAKGLCGTYCYAREFAERREGRGFWGERLIVKANAAELLLRELERAARRAPDHPHHVTRLTVFSASTTDPCAPPLIDSYRRCLDVVSRFPVRLWVVQTRSPAVVRLEREITALGARAVVSFTIETDSEESARLGPSGSPTLAARQRAFERMAGWPITRHLAIAPLLPLADPEQFADWIATYATDATVDTFVSGDGAGGRRSGRGTLPSLLESIGVDWRDETAARELHALLVVRMGGRAGWSAAGFNRLAAERGAVADSSSK